MRCPYCDIAYSPAFVSWQPQFDGTTNKWSQMHTQFCPECHQFIVGVYQYEFGKSEIITKDNFEKFVKLFVPIDHNKPRPNTARS